MEAAISPPGRGTVISGLYLHGLFNGEHGEMQQDPYRAFVAQVAARARARRLELGLGEDEVARRVTDLGHRLKGSSLENWERGDLPLKHAGVLADALEMDWRELLGLVEGAVVPSRDPLEELSDAVERLVLEVQKGRTAVAERLDAIDRRLTGTAGRARPTRRGNSGGVA